MNSPTGRNLGHRRSRGAVRDTNRFLAGLLILGLAFFSVSLGQVLAQSTSASGLLSPSTLDVLRAETPDESVETLRIRRLYVPEANLIQFMQERPSFLPLSADRYRQMLDMLRQQQQQVADTIPLKHWVTVTASGNVQGYSLLSVRPPMHGSQTVIDDTDTWVSLDDWTIPADFFSLTPVMVPARDPSQPSRMAGLPRWEYQETPLAVAVNEAGIFGVPMSEVREHMLVRFNLNATNSSDVGSGRPWRIPLAPQTMTVVKTPASPPAGGPFPGRHAEIQSVAGTIGNGNPDRLWQVVAEGSELALPSFTGVALAIEPAARARYTEHSTLLLSSSVGRFESLLRLDFPREVTGELVVEIPDALELTHCEVNGSPQAVAQRRGSNGTRQVVLPWQRWSESNALRIAGTLPINATDRVAIPRVLLPGHRWMQGNLQVTLDAPLRLADYELVDSRMVSCQPVGTSQNLSFHWGGPQSSITVVVDSSAMKGRRPSPTAELLRLLVDPESMEAEHWLIVPYRHRANRLGKMTVEEGWQIDHVAAVSLRDLLEIRSPAALENIVVPLNWYVETESAPIQLNIELPDQFRESEIALRIKATRAVTEWPARTTGRIVETLAAPTGFRPLLLALRGSATLKPTERENRSWQPVSPAEADPLLGVLSRLLDSGTFWLSGNSNRLVLDTESGSPGGYGVLAYTENQVGGSSLVRQTHRLLLQPAGPVAEVRLRQIGEPTFNQRWAAWNSSGQAVPFEMRWEPDGHTVRVLFRTPINEPVSLLVQQDWNATAPGELPLWELPDATSSWGVVDTFAGPQQRLRLEPIQEAGPLTEPARVREFRQSSRQALRQWNRPPAGVGTTSVDWEAPLFANSGTETAGAGPNFDHCHVYQAPARFSARWVAAMQPWAATTVIDAFQTDTWSSRGWRTELIVDLFIEGLDRGVVPLPAGARVTQVHFDEQPIPWDMTPEGVQIEFERLGNRRLIVGWELPHESAFPGLPTLVRVPPAVDLSPHRVSLRRHLELPAGIGPVQHANNPGGWGAALSRRLISPLAWPDPRLALAIPSDVNGAPGHPTPSEWRSGVGDRAALGWHWWTLSEPWSDPATWVVVHRDHRVQCWLALLIGWAAACLSSSPWLQRHWPWGSLPWGIGGLCLIAALLAPWPTDYLTSSLLMGFILGHSWCCVWQRLSQRRRPPAWELLGLVRGNSRARSPEAPSQSRSGSLGGGKPSTVGWLIWWLAFLAVGLAGSRPLGEAAALPRLGPKLEPPREFRTRTAPTALANPDRDPFHSVVIPVNNRQQPTGSVVYVSPELYRRLTELTMGRRRSRDLEIRSVQHTLDYDPQLQRFAQLTSQLTCRTHEARAFRIPYAASERDVIRQVRVNGVPVVFQRIGDGIEIALDVAANLISITSDLQSTGAVVLNLTGAADSTVNLRGVPNGFSATLTEHRTPSLFVQSATQRRFRVDRLKRVLLSVSNQAETPRESTCETWLTVDAQKIDCETRFSAPRLMAIRQEFLFQVDPRLSLPPGNLPAGDTWQLERVVEESRPTQIADGPLYRIRLSPNHPPDGEIRISWDFAARSFGQLSPPRIEFLEQEALQVRHWIVVRVAKNLVYHPQDLARTAFRRASEFEWLANSATRPTSPGPLLNPGESNLRDRSTEGSAERRPEPAPTNDLYLYQVLDPALRQTGDVIGRLAAQPVQVTGSLQQIVNIDSLTAKISVKGEIQVTQGELSQWRFIAPPNGKVLQLSWLAGAQNLVAWHARRTGQDQDEIIVFLRSPISGSTRLDCLYEVPLYTAETPKLPWIRFPTWMEVSQSVQVAISNPARWKLSEIPTSETRPLETSPPTPSETFLVSAESTSEMERWQLTGASEPPATGAVVYLWDSEGPQPALRMSLELSAKQLVRNIVLEQVQGLGLPTTIRALDAQGGTLPMGPWQRREGGFQAEFADPILTARLDLEIPVVVGNQEIGLPIIKDGTRDFGRYFAATQQETETQILGGVATAVSPEIWRSVQPLTTRSVWSDQWSSARRWLKIEAGTRDGARLVLRNTAHEGRSAAMLGNRFYLQAARPSASHSGLQVFGLQQLVLQTQGLAEIQLEIPAGVEIHQAWLDDQRLPWERATDAGAVRANVPLDPLAEYAVLTLATSATLLSADQKLELARLSSPEALPLTIALDTVDGKLPPGLALGEMPPRDQARGENAALVARVLEQTFADPDWIQASGAVPENHPLRAGLALAAASTQTELEGWELVRAPLPGDSLDRPTDSQRAVRWLLASLGALIWIAGILRPQALPGPAVWGDVGWILLGSVAWFAAADVALVVLFWTVGFSWLALRAFPDSFYRRNA